MSSMVVGGLWFISVHKQVLCNVSGEQGRYLLSTCVDPALCMLCMNI